MTLRMLGASHLTCALEIRERLAVPPPRLPIVLEAFQRRFPAAEAVLLSTCNRTELYTAATDPTKLPTQGEAIEFLAEAQGLTPHALRPHLTWRRNVEAIRHLFRVAASLESMVVGEAQILAQVKAAYQLATDAAATGQRTHSVFQAALRVARRVARETRLHEHRVSIPSIAVRDFIPRVFERLDDKTIAVLGTGEMGRETLSYLTQSGARRIQILVRDPEKGKAVAKEWGGVAVPWSEWEQTLAAADLVVSATNAAETLITLEMFRRVEAIRRQRPLCVIDLAVPRDFDPAIGNCLGVYLVAIDDLRSTCEEHQARREAELPLAQRIIDEEISRFLTLSEDPRIAPTIRSLRESADEIERIELERLLRRLPNIDAETREEITQAIHRVVRKILHPPLESLRQGHPSTTGRPLNLVDAVIRLFQLRDD